MSEADPKTALATIDPASDHADRILHVAKHWRDTLEDARGWSLKLRKAQADVAWLEGVCEKNARQLEEASKALAALILSADEEGAE